MTRRTAGCPGWIRPIAEVGSKWATIRSSPLGTTVATTSPTST
ncbi:MAG: hypothetical protein R3B09_25385 [Nannocystaceae bacterium]